MLETPVHSRRRAPDVNPNARGRVIAAIQRRLDELPMTGRAFGRGFSANDGKGHGDQWVSNLLKNKHALALDELDEAAHILKCSPTELVRSDFEHAEYLTPTEHRILQAVRRLPVVIRDHLMVLSEYLVGVAPEEIEFLEEFRQITAEERERFHHWVHMTRISRESVPALVLLPDQPETTGRSTEQEHRTRERKRARRK